MLLRDYLPEWLSHHAKLKDLNPRSVKAYQFVVNRLSDGLGSLALEDSGDDEYVFAHPRTGGKLRRDWYAEEFRKARQKVGIED